MSKFGDIIDPKTGKTEIRYVDVTTDSYRIARQYMIRLEARDLQDEFFLQKLAMAAKMTPEQFKDRFKHVAV